MGILSRLLACLPLFQQVAAQVEIAVSLNAAAASTE
jgi:hypothetical protein